MRMRNRVLFGFAILGMAGLTAFLLALYITDYQVRVQKSEFELPKAAVEYEKLAAAVEVYRKVSAVGITPGDEASTYAAGSELLGRLKVEMKTLAQSPMWPTVRSFAASRWFDRRSIEEIKANPFGWDDQMLRDADEVRDQGAAVLAGIHRLAELRFVAFTPEEIKEFQTGDPTQFYRCCGQLLQFSMAHHAYAGRTSDAYADVIAGLKIGDTVGQEPLMLSQRAKDEMLEAVIYTIDPAFGVGDLTPDLALDLASILRPSTTQQPLLDAFATYAAEMNATRVEAAKISFREWVEDRGVYWGARNWIWNKPICRPITNIDDQSLLEIAFRLKSIPNVQYWKLKLRLEALAQYAEGLSFFHHTSIKLGSDADWLFYCAAHRQAARDLARLGILIERHHTLHDCYPSTLGEIDGLVGPPPVDPFTGDSYHYLLRQTGFIVSSPGKDTIDNVAIRIGDEDDEPFDATSFLAELPPELTRYYPKRWGLGDDIVWRPIEYLPPKIDYEQLLRLKEILEERNAAQS